MASKAWTLSDVVIALVLLFNLAGCAQTQPVLQESGAAVKQNEKMEWVDPKGSGQSTDWGVYMAEEGGGR
jgi:hypothetical protein